MSLVMRLTDRAVGLRARSSGPRDPTESDLRAALDPDRAPARVPRGVRRTCEVETVRVAGRSVLRVAPRSGAREIDVVYLHGGAYVNELAGPHWWILARLIRRTGATVVVPSYPLAPEHTYDDAAAVVEEIVDAAPASARAAGRRCVLAGDSAGGGLALAQALRLRDAGGPLPDAVVTIAPWVDITTSDPESRRRASVDRMLSPTRLDIAARWWAGDRDPRDPALSPLFADLAGLPPLTLVVGGRDLLAPAVFAFADKARSAGVDVVLEYAHDGFHVYPAAFWTPEGRRALDVLAAGIRG